MGEVLDIPFRKIRGTKEWREEQERLREAVETIQQSLEEQGLLGRTIEGPEAASETLAAQPAGRRRYMAGESPTSTQINPTEFLVLMRRWKLARLLEEHGQMAREMCQEKRADGRRCRYPVADGQTTCRAHAEWKAGPLAQLPFPDDALGLQRLMAKLLSGLMYEGMDPLKAKVAADVCRTMRANLQRCAEEAAEAEEESFF